MKRVITRVQVDLLTIISLLSFFVGICPKASAQGFAIDWWTVGGGGGTSTGGVFSVSATIGQPIAGAAMTNGGFSLAGGFWALPVAVQAPEAPLLTIVPAGPGQASISWTPNTPGFVLRVSPSLTSPTWADAPSGATNPVVVPATLPVRFYRLFKQ